MTDLRWLSRCGNPPTDVGCRNGSRDGDLPIVGADDRGGARRPRWYPYPSGRTIASHNTREARSMSLANAPFSATLPAHDIARAQRWYEEKLGLAPVMDMGVAGLLYSTGDSQWLIYQTPSAGTGKHTLGGLLVDDIDETMKELRGRGVKFEDYDMGDQGPTTENGVARDPT